MSSSSLCTMLSFLLAVLLSSCATSHGLVRSGFQPREVHDMPFASPVALVSLIEQGNRPQASEGATAQSIGIMRLMLTRYSKELHLSKELLIPDTLYQQAYQQLSRAADGIAHRQRLETGASLPALDYLLAGQRQRYVLLTLMQGFTRTPENYDRQVNKTIGVGLLTMGRIVPIAFKAQSNIYVLIYDRQQGQIVYFNQALAEREPTDAAVVEKQLRQMLASDFPAMKL